MDAVAVHALILVGVGILGFVLIATGVVDAFWGLDKWK